MYIKDPSPYSVKRYFCRSLFFILLKEAICRAGKSAPSTPLPVFCTFVEQEVACTSLNLAFENSTAAPLSRNPLCRGFCVRYSAAFEAPAQNVGCRQGTLLVQDHFTTEKLLSKGLALQGKNVQKILVLVLWLLVLWTKERGICNLWTALVDRENRQVPLRVCKGCPGNETPSSRQHGLDLGSEVGSLLKWNCAKMEGIFRSGQAAAGDEVRASTLPTSTLSYR